MHKLNQGVLTDHHPDLEPFHQARSLLYRSRELVAVDDGFWVFGGCLPGDASDNGVLCLHVGFQKTYCQIFCTIWAPDTLFLTGPVKWPLPQHPLHVVGVQVLVNNETCMTHHPYHLPQVLPQVHPVKHLHQSVECPLEPFCLRQRWEKFILKENISSTELHG